MRYLKQNITRSHITGCLFSLLTVLITTGCEDPANGGTSFTLNLPTDTLLNLHCVDVGINSETCVLDDPENPFRNAVVSNFNQELDMAGEDQPPSYKFNINDLLPPGPTGAKARFYLWATAMARSPSGENQYYTALALHELFDDNADPLIQAQAIRAYRSVLDNFYGTVSFTQDFPFAGAEFSFPFSLNSVVAETLIDPTSVAFAPLFDDDGNGLVAKAMLGSWGYIYDNGVLRVSAVP